MSENNKQQWYLHTFATTKQDKAQRIMYLLQNGLKSGEQYVLLETNGSYRFQVHTKFSNLNLKDVNITRKLSSQNCDIFNQTKKLPGAKLFTQQNIILNPMQMNNNHIINNNQLNNIVNNNIQFNRQNQINIMNNMNMRNNNQINIMNNMNMRNNNQINIMNNPNMNMMMNKQNNINRINNMNNVNLRNNNQFNNMNNINLMNKNQMMMQNNINQQKNMREKNKQQENIDKLRILNPKNCNTQHISWFFNKKTILEEANKNRETIHPANNNIITQYMNWFSKYINDMYVIINYSALGKNDKKKCWQDIIGQNFDQITESTLTALANTDFLNKRSRAIDGSNLIEDINEAMKYFAECSLQIYQRKKNINDILKIVTVYNQLRSYLNANPKAFVDRGILGFGTDRDNAFREIVNENVKVKNLKDLIVGVIELIA